jgi:hypothetical protein
MPVEQAVRSGSRSLPRQSKRRTGKNLTVKKPRKKEDQMSKKNQTPKDDIVLDGAIHRWHGDAKKPCIKKRTENGGWELACHGTAEQMEIVWGRMYADRDQESEIVKQGCDLVIRQKSSAGALVESNPQPPVAVSLNLQSIAAHMDYRYTIIKNPSRAASRAVIELGFLVLLVKRELKHGELKKWITENTKVTETWANFCRRAAEKFCDMHGEQALLTLCNPSADNPPEAVEQAEQLMMDFTKGVGPTALLHNLGIKKRESGGGSDEPPSDEPRELILARTAWQEIVNAIASHQQDWLLLTDHEIEMINDTLWPVAKQINASTKSKKG